MCLNQGQCFDGVCRFQSSRVECSPPTDPCEESFCNPSTGGCETRQKCGGGFGECFTEPTCNNGVCSQSVPVTDGRACSSNPCYTGTTCESSGLCFGPGATPREGFVCATTACGTLQCMPQSGVPPGFPNLFCAPVSTVNCEPTANNCTSNICNPLTGQCEIVNNCQDQECAAAVCSNEGECTFVARVGETSNTGITTTIATTAPIVTTVPGMCLTCASPLASPTGDCGASVSPCLGDVSGVCPLCLTALVTQQPQSPACSSNALFTPVMSCILSMCPSCSNL